MPWPTDDLSTAGVDSGTDRPPRAEFFKLFQRVKTIIAGRGSADGVASLDGRRRVPDAELGRGVAGGVAALDGAGRVPSAQLPPQPTPPQAVPPGTIAMHAGARPNGWLTCNGSAVSRATYPDLFAVIGTTYGPGDGSTTFNLPDLRDRFALGATSNPPGRRDRRRGDAHPHGGRNADAWPRSRRRAPGRRGRGSKQAHRHNRHCVHGGRRQHLRRAPRGRRPAPQQHAALHRPQLLHQGLSAGRASDPSFRAHDPIPRARPFRLARPGRARLNIPRARLYSARETFQARATRACATPHSEPAAVRLTESHLSHLIPLNPGESRFEINVVRVPRAIRATVQATATASISTFHSGRTRPATTMVVDAAL